MIDTTTAYTRAKHTHALMRCLFFLLFTVMFDCQLTQHLSFVSWHLVLVSLAAFKRLQSNSLVLFSFSLIKRIFYNIYGINVRKLLLADLISFQPDVMSIWHDCVRTKIAALRTVISL